MAGDWIKLEHATATKPEVCLAAELLNITRREMVGLLVDYWIWLDNNLGESRDGVVTQVLRKSVEDVLHCPGFASILETMRWATFDDKARTLTIHNWERHNGKSAKTRALTRDRMKRSRDDCVTHDASPEKRRVLTTPTVPKIRKDKKSLNAISSQLPTGFISFWQAYPAEHRRVAKAECVKVWESQKLEPIAATIVNHVKAMAVSEQWRQGYEPAPLKYLRGRRWEDELPATKVSNGLAL